jgi:hypothetical protein
MIGKRAYECLVFRLVFKRSDLLIVPPSAETFIKEPVLYGNRMKDIVATRKMENGIACYYGEPGSEKMESYTYSELIDMKINALDLLDDPKNYGIDEKTRQVIMKK